MVNGMRTGEFVDLAGEIELGKFRQYRLLILRAFVFVGLKPVENVGNFGN